MIRRFTGNMGIRAAAFVITVFLCVNAETDRRVKVEVDVPIRYVHLPDSLVRMGTAPDEVRVRALFHRRFWQTRPESLSAAIDVSRARRGTHRFPVTADMIRAPVDRDARVIEVVGPRRIHLTFEPKIRRSVPVRPDYDGAPADGFVLLGEPVVEPGEVALKGPESVVGSVEEVLTRRVSLAGATEDVRLPKPIETGALDQVVSEPAQVEVYFDIERIEDRILQKRPMRTAPRYRISVEPDSLDLVVRGPASVLASIHEGRTRLYLDLSALPAGEHVYVAEVVEGNRIHFFPQNETVELAPADSAGASSGEELSSPELEGEVQNLPDLVVLVGVSPKMFTIKRRGR